MDTGNPFYVGKGSDNRATSKKDRNLHWKRIVAKVGYESIIIHSGLNHRQALNAEMFAIAALQKVYKLANMTRGGDGGNGLSGSDHPLFGKPRSQETKNKLSNALIGRTFAHCANRFGIKHTTETKQKISAALKGRAKTQEHITKVAAAIKASTKPRKPRKPVSEETKLKISLAQKGRKLTEKHRLALCKPKTKKVM